MPDVSVNIPPISFSFNLSYEKINEIKKWLKMRKGLFGKSRLDEVEKIFRDALLSAQHGIEYQLWYGKGFAIQNECGIEVDKEFHHLFGLEITIFNEVYMKFDSSKINDSLLQHLIRQLKRLENTSGQFFSIQGISSHQDKKGDALKMTTEFRKALLDFLDEMKPYIKQESR